DAHGALSWCEANLTGSSLAQAVGGVLKGAAQKDVATAAALVSSLAPSPARTEAAVQVAAKWFPEFNSQKPVNPDAIAWLGTLDAESSRRVLQNLSSTWASCDPQSLTAFLETRSNDQIPSSVYSILARELVRKDPMAAMEW